MKKKLLSLLAALFALALVIGLRMPVSAIGGGIELPDIGFEEDAASGQCGENLTWVLDSSGVLSIFGTGPMDNCQNWMENPWYAYHCDIVSVVIEKGVTTVGDEAFSHCINLTSATIPDSVTAIGDNAFSDCGNLEKLYFKGNAPEIGEGCFSGTTTTVYYPGGNTTWTDAVKQSYGGTITWQPQLGKVTGVKAVSASATSVKISWNKVPGATKYAVYQYANGKYTRIKNTTATSFTHTGLSLNKSYTYAVKAYTPADGVNVYGATSAKATAKTVLPKVTGVKATSAGATSIKLSWGKVTGATRYAVYRYNTKTKAYDRIKNVTTTSYTDTGLTPGTSYKYAVKAYTPVSGKNVYGATSAKVTLKAGLAQVTGLKATSAGATSIKLTWSKVTGATRYAVYRYNAKTKAYDRIANVTTNSFTDTKRTPGTAYKYAVKAYTPVSGKNVYGATSAKVTLKAGLAQVTGLKATSAGATSIKLSWKKVPGATKYAVYRYNASTGKYDRIKNVTTNYFTDTGRTVGKSYTYIIKAYTAVNGKNVYSANSAKVTLKAGLAQVTGIKAVTAGSGKVKLTWTKVPGATRYAIYRYNIATGKWDRIKNVTANYYTDTGLKAGKSYTYIIRSYAPVSGKNVYSPNSAKIAFKVK